MQRRLGLRHIACALLLLGGCADAPDRGPLPPAPPAPRTAGTDADGALRVIDNPRGLAALPEGERLWPARADGRPWFGMTDNAVDERLATPEEVAQFASALGAQFVRTTIYWPGLEPARGRYDWGLTDDRYLRFVRRGLRPLWTLLYTPRYAVAPLERGRCTDYFCEPEPAPRNLADLERFARELSRRYPLSAGFEYRNEPNITPRCGQPGAPKFGPRRYAAGLRAFAAGVHSARPAARVVGGVLSNCPGTLTGYLAIILAAGAAADMDALSFHPYDFSPGGDDFERQFDEVRATLAAGGAEGARLLAGEVGVSTGEFGEAEQSRRLRAQYAAVARMPDVDGFAAFTTVEKRREDVRGFGWLRAKDRSGRFAAKHVVCDFRAELGSPVALPAFVTGC